ncbi:hypothetical protein AVT69_gp216 [Pseudomonas phage PhiPA3]|uniref:Uncharacterized protein 218 n=1 Tax=Pseudomonas phage PhiPA3 TaxID=998086 RepID=F8SJ61_BPPA3|nr:hypothetical protein AVT69_gp216 [Pseudomonas phage PhiPA3]AEH03641.1 hypothetical protein [Pseudomonas phage PhiPA3]
MALSDCYQCWETPCKCGHDYMDWTEKDLKGQIAMLQGVLHSKQTKEASKLAGEEMVRYEIRDLIPVRVKYYHGTSVKVQALDAPTYSMFKHRRLQETSGHFQFDPADGKCISGSGDKPWAFSVSIKIGEGPDDWTYSLSAFNTNEFAAPHYDANIRVEFIIRDRVVYLPKCTLLEPE